MLRTILAVGLLAISWYFVLSLNGNASAVYRNYSESIASTSGILIVNTEP
mgnify:CR=1 FL=1